MCLETNARPSQIDVCRNLGLALSFQDYQALGGEKTVYEYGVVLKSHNECSIPVIQGPMYSVSSFNLGCVLPFVLVFIPKLRYIVRQVLEAGRIVLQ